MRNVTIGAAALLFLCGITPAQTSASYTLEEYSFNAGGSPSPGAEPSSPGFRLTLSSIGDGVAAIGLSGANYEADGGFGVAYPPPGEVAPTCGEPSGACLQFADAQTLSWPTERSAGVYTLYRDGTADGYGDCEQQDLTATTTTDPSVPPTGAGFFYLVTVVNRLAEEGTRGFASDDSERLGATDLPVCP